ncbi:MAG: hypothetical protein ACKVT0_11260, partial [Planctomycetaceae bacterium]
MNLRLNRETDLIWICMGAVVFTLLLPWILGAGPSSPEFEDRKREIENMSADERQQLEANFEAYKKSQQYLRDEYRKLHEAVDADSELLSLLNEYCELVKTLRPEQRDELKRTHDPHERLILVGRYLYESGPLFDAGSPSRPGQPPSAADSLHRYAYRIIEFL